MSGEIELRIRERAHDIWEREGRPTGREVAHWHLAVAEVAAEQGAPARKARTARGSATPKKAAPARAAAASAASPSKSRKPAE